MPFEKKICTEEFLAKENLSTNLLNSILYINTKAGAFMICSTVVDNDNREIYEEIFFFVDSIKYKIEQKEIVHFNKKPRKYFNVLSELTFNKNLKKRLNRLASSALSIHFSMSIKNNPDIRIVDKTLASSPRSITKLKRILSRLSSLTTKELILSNYFISSASVAFSKEEIELLNQHLVKSKGKNMLKTDILLFKFIYEKKQNHF